MNQRINTSAAPLQSRGDEEKRPSSTSSVSTNITDSLPTKNTEKLSNPTLSQLTIDGQNVESDAIATPAVSPGVAARALGPCAECGLRINNLNDACHAMGYLYHNACFVCCYCQRTLCGKIFYKDQDKIYCEEDYLYCGFQQTAEKCSVCGHLISERILQALGNSYHPGCFTCTVCCKCLDGVPFAIDAHDLTYCLQDYHLVYAPHCSVCGLVILPEQGSNEIVRVAAMNREFHLECYRCSDCRKTLGDEIENRCYPMSEYDPNIPEKNIQTLLCLSCHIKRIGAIPATTAGTTCTSPKPTGGTVNPLLRTYPLSPKFPNSIPKSSG
ncbi:LIM domain-containing protein jub [Paragonimus heterotremus]|uniref:LIM domain-containing protein jub n=1 Tax=Paragonimus heterotremus TaxID=100268 RepID=A0A8J4SME2_9TREM|nr:LIM domain-containing protein jub [Paragonimus heterotremus]